MAGGVPDKACEFGQRKARIGVEGAASLVDDGAVGGDRLWAPDGDRTAAPVTQQVGEETERLLEPVAALAGADLCEQ